MALGFRKSLFGFNCNDVIDYIEKTNRRISFEYALINFVAEKETQRLSEEINPCDILRTMFIEYSLRGSEWFFPYPKRKEIEMLKEKLKNQE